MARSARHAGRTCVLRAEPRLRGVVDEQQPPLIAPTPPRRRLGEAEVVTEMSARTPARAMRRARAVRARDSRRCRRTASQIRRSPALRSRSRGDMRERGPSPGRSPMLCTPCHRPCLPLANHAAQRAGQREGQPRVFTRVRTRLGGAEARRTPHPGAHDSSRRHPPSSCMCGKQPAHRPQWQTPARIDGADPTSDGPVQPAVRPQHAVVPRPENLRRIAPTAFEVSGRASLAVWYADEVGRRGDQR